MNTTESQIARDLKVARDHMAVRGWSHGGIEEFPGGPICTDAALRLAAGGEFWWPSDYAKDARLHLLRYYFLVYGVGVPAEDLTHLEFASPKIYERVFLWNDCPHKFKKRWWSRSKSRRLTEAEVLETFDTAIREVSRVITHRQDAITTGPHTFELNA